MNSLSSEETGPAVGFVTRREPADCAAEPSDGAGVPDGLTHLLTMSVGVPHDVPEGVIDALHSVGIQAVVLPGRGIGLVLEDAVPEVLSTDPFSLQPLGSAEARASGTEVLVLRSADRDDASGPQSPDVDVLAEPSIEFADPGEMSGAEEATEPDSDPVEAEAPPPEVAAEDEETEVEIEAPAAEAGDALPDADAQDASPDEEAEAEAETDVVGQEAGEDAFEEPAATTDEDEPPVDLCDADAPDAEPADAPVAEAAPEVEAADPPMPTDAEEPACADLDDAPAAAASVAPEGMGVADILSRLERLEEALDRLAALPAPPAANPVDVVAEMDARLTGLADRIEARLADLASRPVPTPNLTAQHRSFAAYNPALSSFLKRMEAMLDAAKEEGAARLAKLEERIASLEARLSVSNEADANPLEPVVKTLSERVVRMSLSTAPAAAPDPEMRALLERMAEAQERVDGRLAEALEIPTARFLSGQEEFLRDLRVVIAELLAESRRISAA